jgi:tetratricopeptide (TPR) repeat protein
MIPFIAASLYIFPCAFSAPRAQDNCLDKAKQSFAGKQYKQAIMTLQKCEQSAETDKLLGLAYFELSYMDDAKKHLERAIAAYPKDVGLKIKYADAFAFNRQFKKGVEEFRKLAAAYPDSLNVKKGLARVLGWNREYKEAITIYRQIIAGDPGDFESWIEIGVLTSWDKKFTAALDEFQKILAAKPPAKWELKTRTHIAEVLSWMRKFDDSVAEYDKVITMEPKQTAAYLGKGQVLEWQGAYKAAMTVYEQALLADPESKDAKAKLQQLMWVK